MGLLGSAHAHLEKVSWPSHLGQEFNKQLGAGIGEHARKQTVDVTNQVIRRETGIMNNGRVDAVHRSDGILIDGTWRPVLA